MGDEFEEFWKDITELEKEKVADFFSRPLFYRNYDQNDEGFLI